MEVKEEISPKDMVKILKSFKYIGIKPWIMRNIFSEIKLSELEVKANLGKNFPDLNKSDINNLFNKILVSDRIHSPFNYYQIIKI